MISLQMVTSYEKRLSASHQNGSLSRAEGREGSQ